MAFIPNDDYNLKTLKISLFILCFTLYFTINGFFFSDSTMHKIYEDEGKYNILWQIPQILYSSIITSVIQLVLKYLSLSEQNLLKIKKEKDIKKATNKSLEVKSNLKIKFIIFFGLSSFLMIFFWYFIGCFCAVYSNTQLVLIKDTLTSFGISMLYPFGLNLLPGIFRIYALKDRKKSKKFLYTISLIIAFI